MFEKGGRDKCQGKAEGELQQFGREISEGQLRRCIEMKLNGLLEWNTNALTLCQDLRRRTLIHLIDWRVTCWSLGLLSATLLSLCECSKLPKLPVLHLHWRRLPRLRKVYFSQGLLYDVEDILAGVLHICQQSNFPELWLMEGLPVTRPGRTNALYWMSPPSPQLDFLPIQYQALSLILTLCRIVEHDRWMLACCRRAFNRGAREATSWRQFRRQEGGLLLRQLGSVQKGGLWMIVEKIS